MNEVRTPAQAESARARRSERGAAAVVAQYIRELSSQHGAGSLKSRMIGPPGQGCFEQLISTSRGG